MPEMAASGVLTPLVTTRASPASTASEVIRVHRLLLFFVVAFSLSDVLRTGPAFKLGVAVRPERLKGGLAAPTLITSLLHPTWMVIGNRNTTMATSKIE